MIGTERARTAGWRPDSRLVGTVAPSPNHDERLGTTAPDSLILHYTGMADGASALAWLRNPASRVSCHYVVDEDGAIAQLVPESRRAWHAGRSFWAGSTDINSVSIGIEIVNAGHDFGLPPFRPRQIESVIALCRDIVARHPIRPERVLAHSDVAPGRKLDPGERFPWDELHAAGIGHWAGRDEAAPSASAVAENNSAAVAQLQADFARYGYGIEANGRFDDPTRAVVAAFQRHFRPIRVDGRADAETVATLRALLRAFPSSAT